MKISLNTQFFSGSYGGGMKFANNLKEYFEARGISVINNLDAPDIDLILHIVPFSHMKANAFSFYSAYKYIKKHPRCLIVHRINECDERKNTKNVNKQLALINSTADYTIYVGSWLINLFKEQGLDFTKECTVIKNGAKRELYTYSLHSIKKEQKIKIVTHHWSPNWMKGWDIYAYLDTLLNSEKYKDKFEFHYIGNKPQDIQTENIIFHPPCSGAELAGKLRENHIYLTASLHDPGPNHVVEGAMCGLPLLYINSGALPEYCNGYGEMFNDRSGFEGALDKLVENYDVYSTKLQEYECSYEKVCSDYYETLSGLINNKDRYIQGRTGKRGGLFSLKLWIKALYYYIVNKIGVY